MYTTVLLELPRDTVNFTVSLLCYTNLVYPIFSLYLIVTNVSFDNKHFDVSVQLYVLLFVSDCCSYTVV